MLWVPPELRARPEIWVQRVELEPRARLDLLDLLVQQELARLAQLETRAMWAKLDLWVQQVRLVTRAKLDWSATRVPRVPRERRAPLDPPHLWGL